jgi:cAMP-dependent protein kinase regulator
VTYAKNDSQRERLKEAVSGILIFRSLDAEQMFDVIDAMFERHVIPGETVIRQGDDGDNFYVIESGTYDVTVRSGPTYPEDGLASGSASTSAGGGDGVARRVHTFDGKGSFGELALMYNMPRSATVVARSAGTLWAMDRRSFRRIVLRSAFRKRKMYEALIEKVPLLQHLDAYERMNVADALSSTSFEDGQCIIREGAEADGMYFIEQGRVRVTITRDGRETDASVVETGGYFGEMALVENAPRSASVYADGGPVRVAFLERKCFERLLGPCLDIMRRNITTYKKSS